MGVANNVNPPPQPKFLDLPLNYYDFQALYMYLARWVSTLVFLLVKSEMHLSLLDIKLKPLSLFPFSWNNSDCKPL